VIPTAPATAKPVFATDADALAAAEKAYVAYLAVSDAVSSDGGRNATRLKPVVSAKWFPNELAAYAKFAKTGDSFVGASGYDAFNLQKNSVSVGGYADVDVYVCADVSKTRELDTHGVDITPNARSNTYAIVAEFVGKHPQSDVLLFAGSQPWSGKSFCS
jgi:hypothetical protein